MIRLPNDEYEITIMIKLKNCHYLFISFKTHAYELIEAPTNQLTQPMMFDDIIEVNV